MVTLDVGFVDRRFPRRRNGRWLALLLAATPLLLVGSTLFFEGVDRSHADAAMERAIRTRD